MIERLFWEGDRVSIKIPDEGIYLRGKVKEIAKDDHNFAIVEFIGGDCFTVNSNTLTLEKEDASLDKN